MPEGDTIFRSAATLDRALGRTRITRFSSVFPHLNRVDETTPIAGRTVERVEAHGKHLVICLSGELRLRTHMRMSGSWHIYRSGERWQRPASQMRIAIETEAFQAIAFQVHDAEWLSAVDLARSELARLGPDVLASDFDVEDAVKRIVAEAARPLCDVLLDQRVLAGLGNVYKSELLFLARAHPLSPAASLTQDVARSLATNAQRFMKLNVGAAADGGITTYRGLRRTTSRSDPSARLWVYGRADAPCRKCGTSIQMARLGQHVRSCYFCPRCQVPALSSAALRSTE
jgi:endonuclease-8